MLITLQPEQEQAIAEAIRGGVFGSVNEFIEAAIASLPANPAGSGITAPRKSRLWELRQGISLGDLSTRNLVDEGRECVRWCR